MPRAWIFALALAAPTVPGAAVAQPAQAAADSPKLQPECKASTSSEVVVCAEREKGQSPYRLDPTVLQAIRMKEAANNPTRLQDRAATTDTCGTGTNLCGGSMVPIAEPVLRIVSSVVKAAQGEDWREPFRNGPDDYQRYQAAKSKRSGISVGVGISSSPESGH